MREHASSTRSISWAMSSCPCICWSLNRGRNPGATPASSEAGGGAHSRPTPARTTLAGALLIGAQLKDKNFGEGRGFCPVYTAEATFYPNICVYRQQICRRLSRLVRAGRGTDAAPLHSLSGSSQRNDHLRCAAGSRLERSPASGRNAEGVPSAASVYLRPARQCFHQPRPDRLWGCQPIVFCVSFLAPLPIRHIFLLNAEYLFST
jgi:hypothetical protein